MYILVIPSVYSFVIEQMSSLVPAYSPHRKITSTFGTLLLWVLHVTACFQIVGLDFFVKSYRGHYLNDLKLSK